MAAVETSLLILLLGGDPVGDASAARLAPLVARTVPTAQVLAASAAHARLAEHGLAAADLAADPTLAAVLTRQRAGWVLVQVRPVGGADPDSVLDAVTTVAGIRRPFTAITTSATESRLAAARSVREAVADATAPPEARLADLVRAADWQALLAAVPATGGSPRQRYYRVMALVRLDRLTEAAQAAAELTAAHPGHVLAEAAGGLIPSATTAPQLRDARPGGREDTGDGVLR